MYERFPGDDNYICIEECSVYAAFRDGSVQNHRHKVVKARDVCSYMLCVTTGVYNYVTLVSHRDRVFSFINGQVIITYE